MINRIVNKNRIYSIRQFDWCRLHSSAGLAFTTWPSTAVTSQTIVYQTQESAPTGLNCGGQTAAMAAPAVKRPRLEAGGGAGGGAGRGTEGGGEQPGLLSLSDELLLLILSHLTTHQATHSNIEGQSTTVSF